MRGRLLIVIPIVAAIFLRCVAAEERQPISPVLTIRGTVFMPDGSVAKDATLLQSTDKLANDIIIATVRDGQFEIKTTGTLFNAGAHILQTENGDFQTSIRLADHTLRRDFLKPMQVTLGPGRTVRVHVTHNDKVVANASVQLMTMDLCQFTSKTNESGIAEFKVPESTQVGHLDAWSNDFKIGGLEPYSTASDFTVEISRAKPFRVHAVNANQRPVADVPFAISIFDDAPHIYPNPTTFQSTNADGDAIFRWIPRWAKGRIDVNISDKTEWRITDHEKDEQFPPDGSRLIKVSPSLSKQRVLVNGTVTGTTSDLTGLLVVLWSIEGEERLRSDVIYTRCDAKGHFVARVLPGCNYDVYNFDLDLVSDFWGGIIAPAGGGVVQPPELKLLPTVPVNIHVTSDPDQKPISHAAIGFDISGNFTGRRHFVLHTDANGLCTAHLAAGLAKVSAYYEGWSLNKSINVDTNGPMLVEMHRKADPPPKQLHGKILLPANFPADHAAMTVTLTAIDAASKGQTTVRADQQGNFSAEMIAEKVVAVVTSPDQDFFGYGIYDVQTGTMEVPIHPTVKFVGRLVNREQLPAVGVSVYLRAELVDPAKIAAPGTPESERPRVDLFGGRTTTTNEDGQFEFASMPQQVEFSLLFTEPNDSRSSTFRKDSIQANNNESPVVYRLDTPADPVQIKRWVEKWFAERLNLCRLTKSRLLLTVSGSGHVVHTFSKNHLYDPQNNRHISAYVPFGLGSSELVVSPGYDEFYADHNWPVAEKNTIFMAVLDETGQELGRETLILGNHEVSAKQLATFLDKHKLPEQDAKAELAAAIAEAKRSDRRIWVHLTRTRGKQILNITYWLDHNRELLSRDYVLFSFNDQRDLNSDDLMKAWKIEGTNRPFEGVLDADGNLLISLENSPDRANDPGQRIEILRKLLKTTAKKLSDDDIDQLILTWPTN